MVTPYNPVGGGGGGGVTAIPVNSAGGDNANYALLATDFGCERQATTAGIQYLVQTDATIGSNFQSGEDNFTILSNFSTGNTFLVAASGVTINGQTNYTFVMPQEWQSACLKRIAASTYQVTASYSSSQLGYNQVTASVTADNDTVTAGMPSCTYYSDGVTPIVLELYCAHVSVTANGFGYINLYVDGSAYTGITVQAPQGTAQNPVSVKLPGVVLAAGSHTISGAVFSGGAYNIIANAGAAGSSTGPMWVRVSL